MKTSSAKAKGRRLQNYVAELLRARLQMPDSDIRPQLMGGTGEDILMSDAARKALPISIECKNQEAVNIWKAYQQASDNAPDGTRPAVVFTKNRSEILVTLTFNDFLDMVLGESNG